MTHTITIEPIGQTIEAGDGQTVLDACKEFHIPCGFPATENDIEMRMKQGFNFFVVNWGDAGFRTVELGRKIAGR